VNATEDFANSDALYKWFNMTATDTALALPDDIEKDLDDRAKKMVAEYIYVASHND
jgi:predicted PP-loop superfamily ATPase